MFKEIRVILRSGLVKSAGIYGVLYILNALTTFLLLPVLTRHLSPEDYGIVAIFNVLVGFVTPFIGLSLQSAVSSKFYSPDCRDIRAYVSACMSVIGVATVIVGAVVWFGRGYIEQLTNFPADWVWAVVIAAACQSVLAVALVLFQMHGKPIRYGALQILQSLLTIGLSLVFVVVIGLGWKGRVWAQLAATVPLAGIVLIFFAFTGWLVRRQSRADMKEALRFGLPLLPHSLASYLTAALDRILLSHMAGVAQTGLYTVGYQIGSVISLSQDAFNQAWVPWLFERLKRNDPEENRRIVIVSYTFCGGILAVALLVGLTAPWYVPILVGPKFAGAAKIVIWVTLSGAFNGMYKTVGNYLFYTKKTGYLSIATTCSAVVSALLNFYFIPRNGAVGAAQSATITGFLYFIVIWWLAARIYPMPWNLARPKPSVPSGG